MRKHDVSGPKKISQVKMCHLVTGLLKNIVARSVENVSHDGLCFDVSIFGASSIKNDDWVCSLGFGQSNFAL